MKRIGLIGGLGPESTLEYYRGITEIFREKYGNHQNPEMVIYSVNLGDILKLQEAEKYDALINIFVDIIDKLRKAGADFAAITANTPHYIFPQISKASVLPLISIVEATCRETLNRGYQRPGLFGTGFTMKGTFYQEVFDRYNLSLVLPSQKEKEFLHEKIFTEIELGIFKPETHDALVNIIKRMVIADRIDSLILGCTEFPLILTGSEYAGIPMLNTTAIHTRAIVDYCLND